MFGFFKKKTKEPETIVIDIQKDIEMLDKLYSGTNEIILIQLSIKMGIMKDVLIARIDYLEMKIIFFVPIVNIDVNMMLIQ